MSAIKISVMNLNDGTTSFSQVRFYEASDSSGTGATLLTTLPVDLTYKTVFDPGYTTYTYPTGSTSKYYATTFYNPTSGAYTDYSSWVLGGLDRWDTMFMNDLNDTAGAVWSATDRALYKKSALEALYPDLFQQVTDTSLTLDNDSTPTYTYSLPFGMFNISEVGIGDVNNSTSTFQTLPNDNWAQEGYTLHLLNIPATESSATIRLIGHKKYMEVGEVPERYDGFILYHMKMDAYLKLADDFPRFNKWAQLQEGTKVNFENLRVHAREFERKFKEGKAEVKDTLYPSLL